ncbi:MAG: hypothetical protein IPK34_13225 [Ramlibacter sp.]|nr:hypothetical protein [Ramlibacter sp.]
MKHAVIRRDEMLSAALELGGEPIDLADYATTGLMAVAVGPRGNGKTNAGLVIAEQLAAQGWVSVLIDPELELESLYGKAVADPAALEERGSRRATSRSWWSAPVTPASSSRTAKRSCALPTSTANPSS